MKNKSIIISGILFVAISINSIYSVKAYVETYEGINTNKYIEEVAIGEQSNDSKCQKCENFEEKYFSILKDAEKYVPGIEQKGEEIFKERMELKKELRIALKKQKEETKDKKINKKEIKRMKKQKVKTKKSFKKFVKDVKAGEAKDIEKTFNKYYENSKYLNKILEDHLRKINEE